MKHLGLAAPETDQHVHQQVLSTPEQFQQMTDDQLDRAEAAYTALATLKREVAADERCRASFGARAADPTSLLPSPLGGSIEPSHPTNRNRTTSAFCANY